MNKRISDYIPGIILFVLALLVGLFVYRDYGMSWDELSQRAIGSVNYDYVFNNKEDLFAFHDRQYGPFYELLLVIIERKASLMDLRDVFLFRHLFTHILFLLCCFSFYVLVLNLFKKKTFAVIGFLILLCSPRIYAHSFFNTKDLPFFSLIVIALTIAYFAFKEYKIGLFGLLGLVLGLATSTRILGIMFVAFILLFVAIDIILNYSAKEQVKRLIGCFFIFGIVSALTTYASWPYLWRHPRHNFLESFSRMSHFNWEGRVLLNGQLYAGKGIPSSYFFTWFSISTPILWLLLGVIAMGILLFNLLRNPIAYLRNTDNRTFLFYFMCMVTPVCMVIFLHSVIYDDWRHLYFIYPPFILLLLYGVEKMPYHKAVLGLSFLQIGWVAFFMIKNHPFQQVYFNELVSHKPEYLRHNYEMDYWGVSMYNALRHIAATDTAQVIGVNTDLNDPISPLTNNILMLPPETRKRFVAYRNPSDYFITIFRGHTNDFDMPKVVYAPKVLNSTIVCVYKTH